MKVSQGLTDFSTEVFKVFHSRVHLDVIESSIENESSSSHKLLRQLIRDHSPELLQGSNTFVFPHAKYSMTHSGGRCFVALSPMGRGLGIDAEWVRPVDQKIIPFFLTEEEQRQFVPSQPSDKSILRLWTLKEASFKADISNQGRILKNYSIQYYDEQLGRGRVLSLADNQSFEVLTSQFGRCLFSLALAVAQY